MNNETSYLNLIKSLESLLKSDYFEISILANTSALIKDMLTDISWVGFYLLKDNQLLLGPFQGKVACTKIKVGSGVCGTSVKLKETIVVANVHEFPGHIACDSASNSEIVVPIIIDNEVYGVLDLDSYQFNRFTNTDKIYLEEVVNIVSKNLQKIKSGEF